MYIFYIFASICMYMYVFIDLSAQVVCDTSSVFKSS